MSVVLQTTDVRGAYWAASARRVRAAAEHSDRRLWLLAFGLTLGVYLLTAHWRSGQVSDTEAAIWPAWNFVHHGSFFLDNHPVGLPDVNWFVPLRGHVVSNRMMGAILAGVPVCAAFAWTDLSPATLNALGGALMAAVAAASMTVVVRRLASFEVAIPAAAVLSFGTPLWTVAGSELWPQSVDAMCLSLMLLALTTDRVWWAGIAVAPALTSRPHLAVVAAVVGLGLSFTRRSFRPAAAIGVPSAAAVALLLWWNHWMFGRWGIGGAYTGSESKMTTLSADPGAVRAFVTNAIGAAFSPGLGLFVFTPVALVAVWWMVRCRAAAPDWARAALVGGLGYQAVQLHLDVFHGGGGFFGNRLAIELIILSVPMAVATYPPASARAPWLAFIGASCAAASVATHSVGAFLSWYLIGTPRGAEWTVYYPARVVEHAGVNGLLVALPAVLCLAIFVGHRYLLARSAIGAASIVEGPTVTRSGELCQSSLKAKT